MGGLQAFRLPMPMIMGEAAKLESIDSRFLSAQPIRGASGLFAWCAAICLALVLRLAGSQVRRLGPYRARLSKCSAVGHGLHLAAKPVRSANPTASGSKTSERRSGW